MCGLLCPGLVHEECITKMRLMSLAGLASKGSGEISYSVVRDTLKVDFIFQCYRLLWMLHVAFFMKDWQWDCGNCCCFPLVFLPLGVLGFIAGGFALYLCVIGGR